MQIAHQSSEVILFMVGGSVGVCLFVCSFVCLFVCLSVGWFFDWLVVVSLFSWFVILQTIKEYIHYSATSHRPPNTLLDSVHSIPLFLLLPTVLLMSITCIPVRPLSPPFPIPYSSHTFNTSCLTHSPALQLALAQTQLTALLLHVQCTLAPQTAPY